MDGNLLKEIHYLTRLIEQHKRKLPDKHNINKNLSNQDIKAVKSEKCTNIIHRSQQSLEVSNESFNSAYGKCQLAGTNVHVNPNFKPCNPVIHINPKVRLNPLIHVNPRMMKDVTGTNKTSETKPANTTLDFKENTVQTDVKKSVYVNPKLMKKLTSVTESKPVGNKQVVPQETIRPVCSRLKFVKATSAIKVTPKKINNSSVVILSKRKLVRVRRASKGSACSPPIGLCKVKKPLISPFKMYKVNPQKIVRTKLVNAVQQSTNKDLNFAKLPAVKPKINKYRIDRTKSEAPKSKKSVPVVSKKIMNNTMELITIGGVVYKSSKNQLVRRSYSLKRKRASPKGDKFIVTTNGKKLRRLKTVKDIQATNVTVSTQTTIATKSLTNLSQRINHKNNIVISNKVKQRSIQILRNKMRKNNQPCLIFQRFGYCANHQKGTCPKLHDKKQVALCKKFLQGNCLLDNCPLSHNVGPEKMPTCKYFLEGCCTRDSCPYRHVKVSSSTPICIEFLQGYCAKGHECKRRHEYLCPEFNKTGKCSKGKYCPYPHKSHSPTTKQADKYVKVKRDVGSSNNQVTPVTEVTSSCNHENRLRYYEQPDILSHDLSKKREDIMRKIQIMKNVKAATDSGQNTLIDVPTEKDDVDLTESNESESELEIISETKVFKRPPIGSLPAYIPIG